MVNITEISQKEREDDLFVVSLDNETSITVSSATLTQFNIFRGKSLDDDMVSEILEYELEILLWKRLSSYLLKNRKTEYEIKDYLNKLCEKIKQTRGIIVKERESLFARLVSRSIDAGFVDDEKYCKDFIESRVKLRMKSRRLIEYELVRKGINKDIIKKSLDESDIDDRQMIKNLLYKRYKTTSLKASDRKKISYLHSKGFEWDDISHFIEE